MSTFARFGYIVLLGGRNETENTIPAMLVKNFGSDQTTVCSPWACAGLLALYVARVVGLFSLAAEVGESSSLDTIGTKNCSVVKEQIMQTMEEWAHIYIYTHLVG